ncbi:MAG: DUF4123 domain-containing protein [Ideonella sp.]|nr:DUF4123 domain-containing protein [Ideonella sp.]
MKTLDGLRADCLALLKSHQSEIDSPPYWYALSDPALDKPTWRFWSELGGASAPLLPKVPNGRVDVVPHLHALRCGSDGLPVGLSSEQSQVRVEAMSLIASRLPFGELLVHMQAFLEVRLVGGVDMLLAFWDNSVLGVLVGQEDDTTLHVRGPVLEDGQRAALLAPIAAWWYADREQKWHRLAKPDAMAVPSKAEPLKLTQVQEDKLVEAGVPDLILYHLKLNRPLLIDSAFSDAKWYRFVRAVLPSARGLGLEGVRDLVNFTALCIIYKQRMQHDPDILQLLDQVQLKERTLDEVMLLMPN